jgi:hypothetical protein
MKTRSSGKGIRLLDRREWLGFAAGAMGLGAFSRGFAREAQDDQPGWRWILASHMFEDSSFFDLGGYFKELLPAAPRMDLWIDYNGNKTSRHFEDIRKRGIPEAAAYCKEQGIELTAATCYGKGYPGYAGEIRQLGCTVCIQSSGVRTRGTMTEMMKKELESHKPALEVAEKNGCRIAIENHSGNFLLNDLDSIKAFMDLCEHPLLGLAFAPFHAQGRKESPETFLEACAPKVFYFYAWQQNPAGTKTAEKASGEAQMPGVGPYDFAPMLRILKQRNPQVLFSPFMHRASRSGRSAELVKQSKTHLETLKF